MNSVKLVALTTPLIEGCTTPEEFIVYCARVSNPSNQDNHATAPKLVKYLLNHGHVSPFEMANMVLEIQAPRDITRQILRHRSFSFQEFSQRYAEVVNFADRQPRLQDEHNRQNSIPLDPNDNRVADWEMLQKRVRTISNWCYAHALEIGIAKEVARVLLPEGLTTSKLYMNGSIRSWVHYCQTRCGEDTQLEHREIAKVVKEILLGQMPSLAAAF